MKVTDLKWMPQSSFWVRAEGEFTHPSIGLVNLFKATDKHNVITPGSYCISWGDIMKYNSRHFGSVLEFACFMHEVTEYKTSIKVTPRSKRGDQHVRSTGDCQASV